PPVRPSVVFFGALLRAGGRERATGAFFGALLRAGGRERAIGARRWCFLALCCAPVGGSAPPVLVVFLRAGGRERATGARRWCFLRRVARPAAGGGGRSAEGVASRGENAAAGVLRRCRGGDFAHREPRGAECR